MIEPDVPPADMCGVRNTIIRGLELAASYDAQLEYERKVPIAHVSVEVVHSWLDFVCPEHIDEYKHEPFFSDDERAAMKRFAAVHSAVLADLPPWPWPALVELIHTEPWERLRAGAQDALCVFNRRRKFDKFHIPPSGQVRDRRSWQPETLQKSTSDP
jgi:hypothetical protein